MIDPIAALIDQTNRFHLPSPFDPAGAWYKEWYHFCLPAPEFDLIVNFNLSADVRPAASPGSQIARLVVLLREQGGAWEGDVDTIPVRDVAIRPETIDIAFGHNRVRLRNGGFELSLALQNRPVALTLFLEPVALPLLMRSNTPVGQGRINWIVVPRLRAGGTVIAGERVYRLENCPAYHDHNWGSWLWGHDLAWEWGFALPTAGGVPWSIVFDRTTDRGRNRLRELTLAVWRGEKLHRVFTQNELAVQSQGYLTGARPPKFPRVAGLLVPGSTGDIPRRLLISAQQGDDALELLFEAAASAQIVIPNETDLDNTVINEVTGRLTARGQIRQEPLELDGRGIFEFLT